VNWPLVVCLVLGALVIGWPVRRRVRWCLPEGLFARPGRTVVLAAGAIGGLGFVGGGPVAALVAGAYSALAGRAFFRRAARRRDGVSRAAALDALSALAADLRAGLPPTTRALSPLPLAATPLPLAATPLSLAATPLSPAASSLSPVARALSPLSPLSTDRIGRLTASVWRLAERTGAPAADLVERIEADARAADRAAAKAAAQAAGAQATALLLAGLPIGGIGLGLAIGADPVEVLLHTPIGAACAVGAVLLQCGGLLWAERLAR
jgi:tight adherence protein B